MQSNSLSLKIVRQVFGHFNGIAAGAVAQGLHEAGILEYLAAKPSDIVSLDKLIQNHNIIPGYIRMAVETLAAEGLCQIKDGTNRSFQFGLTQKGQSWLAFRNAYQEYDGLLNSVDSKTSVKKYDRYCSDTVLSGSDEIADMVRTHLRAPAISLAMWQIAEIGWDDFSSKQQNFGVLKLMATEAWVIFDRKIWQLTEAGQIALLLASHYAYPICYFPLLQQIPALIMGKSIDKPMVDRALDVEFSAKVFDGPCRDLFFKQLLPIFNNTDISKQPSVIVDSGCGDGTVLLETYKVIKNQTLRGKYLADLPLLMVGVEYETSARNIAAKTLGSSRIPHLTISGDIAKPENIHEVLKRHDIDPGDILHISKSVIHNRNFIQPQSDIEKADLPMKHFISSAYHVTNTGQNIPDNILFDNLVAFFRSWGQWVSHHGMIAIEAHCWSPEHCQTTDGCYPMTLMKTTHGFSKQYLVNAEFYRKAAMSAGFNLFKSDNIYSVPGSPPTMTIDHFIPKNISG